MSEQTSLLSCRSYCSSSKPAVEVQADPLPENLFKAESSTESLPQQEQPPRPAFEALLPFHSHWEQAPELSGDPAKADSPDTRAGKTSHLGEGPFIEHELLGLPPNMHVGLPIQLHCCRKHCKACAKLVCARATLAIISHSHNCPWPAVNDLPRTWIAANLNTQPWRLARHIFGPATRPFASPKAIPLVRANCTASRPAQPPWGCMP